MKNKNIYFAMNGIDPNLIEKNAPSCTVKKTKNRIYRKRIADMAAISACICLVIALSAVLLTNTIVLSDGSIPIWGAEPAADKLQFYGNESSVGMLSSTSRPEIGLSVTAELVEILPDTYTFYDDWSQREYRLLKMKTVKLLVGGGMTDEFYYLVPTGYMTDYTIYDKFVITDMAQCGYEYFAMYNKNTKQAERFDEVLFGYGVDSYNEMGEKFIAYDSNGDFDGKLWSSTDYWKKSTQGHIAPVTLKSAEKTAALQVYEPLPYVNSIKDIAFEDGNGAADSANGAGNILEEFISLKNGVYVPSFDSNMLNTNQNLQFSARRYINGFATNETVSMGANGYTHSKARFDENDLKTLPGLAPAISAVANAFDKGKITPPHIEDYKKLNLQSYGIFAWYAKTEGGVIGIIRVTWNYDGAFDDAYYVIEYGEKKCKPIGRDDLLEKLGEYEKNYIYEGEYTIEGKDFAD